MEIGDALVKVAEIAAFCFVMWLLFGGNIRE